jgi:large subunit ribosomal protein L20
MRVKRGTRHITHRKNLLSKTKGYRWGRKNSVKLAHEAILHAGVHAYTGRKLKKRSNRAVWNVSINAAVRMQGTTYSRFIDALKKNKSDLNRKVLSEIAQKHPEAFTSIVATITTSK